MFDRVPSGVIANPADKRDNDSSVRALDSRGNFRFIQGQFGDRAALHGAIAAGDRGQERDLVTVLEHVVGLRHFRIDGGGQAIAELLNDGIPLGEPDPEIRYAGTVGQLHFEL